MRTEPGRICMYQWRETKRNACVQGTSAEAFCKLFVFPMFCRDSLNRLFDQHSSGLLHCHLYNQAIDQMTVEQSCWIWANKLNNAYELIECSLVLDAFNIAPTKH